MDRAGPRRALWARGPTGDDEATGVAENGELTVFGSSGESYIGEIGEMEGSCGRAKFGGRSDDAGRGKEVDDDTSGRVIESDPLTCLVVIS